MPAFDTPEAISVTIELQLGDVHVLASDRADTVVVVNPSDRSRPVDVVAAAKTHIEFSNGRLVIKTPKPRGLSNYIGIARAASVEMTIELPTNSRLQVDAGFADFRCDGKLGDVRIETGAGDIQLDRTGQLDLVTGAGTVSVNRTSGRAEITSAGDMRIGEVDGDAEIKNLNGKTWVGKVTGALQVKSANGDITVDSALAEVGIKTANGSIGIGEVVSGSIVLETASGGLDIGIRAGTPAWVDARTRFGRVHNALGPAEGPDSAQKSVEIRARTSFGDIVIRRS